VSENFKMYYWKSDPETEVYSGHYNSDDKFHGQGVLTRQLSRGYVKYIGSFQNGSRHGQGKLEQPHGVVYEGEFVSDVPCGLGVLTVETKTDEHQCDQVLRSHDGNGNNSTAHIRTEQRDGVNYLVCRYSGTWINGVLTFRTEEGRKKTVRFDGITYDGCVNSSDEANGNGTVIFPDGVIYVGNFVGNKLTVINKVQYEMRSVEYQHRGLPHCHYVARLTNMPKCEPLSIEWINQNISTEGYANFDRNEHTEEEYKLKELVREKMMHKCSPVSENNPKGCLKDDGTCKKYYDKTKPSPTSFFDDKGFPKYARSEDDLKVVPYCKDILLDWEGHANFEYTEMSYAIGYLYKYIFKNPVVITAETYSKDDEISHFYRTRKICAHDAMRRFMGGRNFPTPRPKVVEIKVKTPSQVDLILYEGKLCKLFVYFQRPDDLTHLTYKQFYEKYTYKAAKGGEEIRAGHSFYSKEFRQRVTNPLNPHQTKAVTTTAVIQKRRSETTLIMLQGMSIKVGEIGYIRMLLKHRPATSFKDLKTHEGTVYKTFQESAKAHGLLKDMDFLKQEFQDTFRHVTSPHERRFHFATWLGQDYPVNFIYNEGVPCALLSHDHEHPGYLYKEMVKDWMSRGYSSKEIKNKFLSEVDKLLSETGSSNETFGLPKAETTTSEVEHELQKYPQDEQRILYNSLEQRRPCNTEQKLFMDTFIQRFHTIKDNPDSLPVLMFLTGSGGTGKSDTLKKVAAKVRSEGYICKIASATALAASVYDDATTFHSLAKIPVIEDCDKEQDYKLTLRLTKERLDLLLAAKVIILDEICFTNKETFEAFYKDTDLKQLNGKVIIGAGTTISSHT
jgi:hypothetical protein